MPLPQLVSFEGCMALSLHVIKEAHPQSKMTYYRFPKSKNAKYSFDPKTEFSIKESIDKLSQSWRK